MGVHPIEGLMTNAMNSIRDMIDVNTIIGDPIEMTNDIVIIPISKVSFGFASGGSEYKGETIEEYKKKDKEEQIQYKLPFGGGSGAGVNINPIAFLILQNNSVKLLPVNHSSAVDKLLDYMPDLMQKVNELINKCIQKQDKTEDIKKYIKNELKKPTIKKEQDIKIENNEIDKELEDE